MNKKGIKTKTGDTLIEVMIAIGIFSLVAISAVAVMNGGTSSIQTSLETTMTRNEIDTQAEALRFIHSSYLIEQNTAIKDGKYTRLWNMIVSLANNSEKENSVAQYSPQSCSDLYDKTKLDNIYNQKAFIIDTKHLNTDAAIIAANPEINPENDPFIPTTLYPRLYDEGELLLAGAATAKAEGIYVVGAKVEKSKHYDFYIRTCWYGSGARTPSTISTVIRLYDPTIKQDSEEL